MTHRFILSDQNILEFFAVPVTTSTKAKAKAKPKLKQAVRKDNEKEKPKRVIKKKETKKALSKEENLIIHFVRDFVSGGKSLRDTFLQNTSNANEP